MVDHISVPKPPVIKGKGQERPKIQNFQDVASYNWLDEEYPTILVPGIPPVLVPPSVPPPVQPDVGPYFIDQNADRSPGSSLQPLFRAVQKIQPDVDFKCVDATTDRHPIRTLLDFLDGNREPFKFCVTILGNTALFSRMERKTPRVSDGHPGSGYRQSFEQKHLKICATAQGSTSHHRIVSYTFGGISFLVRYDVEACVANSVPPHEIEGSMLDSPSVKCVKAGFRHKVASNAPGPIRIISSGRRWRHVHHSDTLELSTSRKNRGMRAKLPDLWISRAPSFVNALYDSGVPPDKTAYFNDIRIQDVAKQVDDWEARNAKKIQQLSDILKDIIKAAMQLRCPCVVSYKIPSRKKKASLAVFRASEEEVARLPEDLESHFSVIEAQAKGTTSDVDMVDARVDAMIDEVMQMEVDSKGKDEEASFESRELTIRHKRGRSEDLEEEIAKKVRTSV